MAHNVKKVTTDMADVDATDFFIALEFGKIRMAVLILHLEDYRNFPKPTFERTPPNLD
jgi:hypothetical protein